MPRVPYVPENTPGPIADEIRARRGSRGLSPLDTMLLNAPPIAEGWSKLLGAIRTGSTLEDDLRETMILRIAVRNKASFEWVQHEPVARAAGVTTEQLAHIGDVNLVPRSSFASPGPGQLSRVQALAVQLADSMTVNVQVRDEEFDALRGAFLEQGDDEAAVNRKMVEAVATCATYNMVSRFLVALDVDERASVPCPVPR
ncbi:AhpD-like protein [Ganoderma leucocontextum]|nr:AhpD-like protein [Ganoderma leucocontextum]